MFNISADCPDITCPGEGYVDQRCICMCPGMDDQPAQECSSKETFTREVITKKVIILRTGLYGIERKVTPLERYLLTNFFGLHRITFLSVGEERSFPVYISKTLGRNCLCRRFFIYTSKKLVFVLLQRKVDFDNDNLTISCRTSQLL